MGKNKKCFLKVGVILGNVTVAGCWSNVAVGLRKETSETKNMFVAEHGQLLLILPSPVIRTDQRHVEAPFRPGIQRTRKNNNSAHIQTDILETFFGLGE